MPPLLFLGAALVVGTAALEQFTPDKADWSTFTLDSKFTDHSPDGFDTEGWEEWDGKTIDPTKYSKGDFHKMICPQSHQVRGLRTLFAEHNPFADLKNPSKAEVDEWHRLAMNHVRTMVGYTAPEQQIKPDKCLHLRALWSDEKKHTTKWDSPPPYDAFICGGEIDHGAHCGGGFIPNDEDQASYLPAGLDKCPKKSGSEGMFGANANYPWSVKWSGALCGTLKQEGFWGGHTGPYFGRSLFGWSFYPGAGLRAKWGGPKIDRLYEDPDIAAGMWLVNGAEPRFPGFECEGRVWMDDGTDTATECYDQIMADETCGKRFVTWNNGGCACYPPEMTTCIPDSQSGRLTWDLRPVPASVDGYFLPEKLYSGKECQDIIWGRKAGDAVHCLEMIMTDADPECGNKYLTWNSVNGGCACYSPAQTTCDPISRSGRETYEISFDAAKMGAVGDLNSETGDLIIPDSAGRPAPLALIMASVLAFSGMMIFG